MLVCIKCGETSDDVNIRVDIANGTDIHCDSCDNGYTVDDVRAVLACWGPYLDWLDANPGRKLQPTCKAPAAA